jgi:hypothetical protein
MEDKRKHLRVNIFAFIAITHNHKKIDAIAYDVSLGGISFVNSRLFEVGDACSIVFNYNGFNVKRSGVVRWRNIISKAVSMKKYGFEFEAVLSDAEFTKICELFIEE